MVRTRTNVQKNTSLQTARDSEVSLRREIASRGDGAVPSMANLAARHTGIDGVIFISSAVGWQGPRVRYFMEPGGDKPSFSVSIAPEPRVLANSLPGDVVMQKSPAVIRWVKLNSAALLDFWHNSTNWTLGEVETFIGRLEKFSRNGQ